MQKIYIGATQMMGKSILWSLLDGDPQILVNLTHIPTGIFLLNKKAIEFIKNKRKSALKRIEDKYLNTLIITYPDKSEIEVHIGDFFYLMYRFGGYANFYWQAKNNVIQFNNMEQNSEFTKFYFDINLFESLIEKKLFNKNENAFHVSVVITILQQNYYACRNQNKKQKPEIFIESLSAGYRPIIDAYENIKDSKFICLKRDPISLCYSNMMRNQGNPLVIRKSYIRKLFFSMLEKTHLKNLFIMACQGEFYKKIITYHLTIQKYKNNKRVLIVDFNDLILRTEVSMRTISKFVGTDYSEILSTPTLEGKSIIKKNPMIGKINNDHLSKFSEKEIDILKNIYSKVTPKSLFYYKVFLYINFSFLIFKSLLL